MPSWLDTTLCPFDSHTINIKGNNHFSWEEAPNEVADAIRSWWSAL